MRVTYRLAAKELASAPAEAAWAESMGYDSVCSNETAHDSFLPLTLAATSTTRTTLETRVAIAFPRSPMITAYLAHDLQELSKGRFRLGLGTQVKGHIQRRFSTDWEAPGPRLRDYVQSLRAIWHSWQTGEKLDHQGKSYQFSLMTPFFSPGPSEYPAPEVFTAAVNSYNCQVAGEVSDGLMLHSLTSPEYVSKVVRPGLEKGAQKAGRDSGSLKVTGGGFIITGPDRSSIVAMQAEVRRRIAFYASTRSYFPVLEAHGFEEIGQQLHQMSLKGEWAEMGELVPDEMLDAFCVSGEYDEIADRFVERYGGLLDEACFTVYSQDPPEEAQMRKMVRRLHELG
ncbi:MAG: TIGR03617 family F420-dependent LLM class oxidoreductase [Chloroflexi bacterium]|nr:TIGR03617 family F420-dependent LLM class oxidoreductase [Chloroflexota bacterium]MDA1269774.1 TIGR03617 family F420-dependent LLM class oxidoreductase [Chloroflexota bacterium]PKB59103.1 MAG: LLM class F420-dependent oxidoreductase [SAR202 cluster bacterium Casp-Chloro-G2]